MRGRWIRRDRWFQGHENMGYVGQAPCQGVGRPREEDLRIPQVCQVPHSSALGEGQPPVRRVLEDERVRGPRCSGAERVRLVPVLHGWRLGTFWHGDCPPLPVQGEALRRNGVLEARRSLPPCRSRPAGLPLVPVGHRVPHSPLRWARREPEVREVDHSPERPASLLSGRGAHGGVLHGHARRGPMPHRQARRQLPEVDGCDLLEAPAVRHALLVRARVPPLPGQGHQDGRPLPEHRHGRHRPRVVQFYLASVGGLRVRHGEWLRGDPPPGPRHLRFEALLHRLLLHQEAQRWSQSFVVQGL
mmetsp:Transcript_128513/g.399921  ORF Transcript_128513/g.399921 Transcript_128513/m.399921 type:complete len:302 (+) Transcript_128513:520-1425(+)